MEERRLMLAFALSFAVLLGFRMWTNSRYPQQAAPTPSPAAKTDGHGPAPVAATVPSPKVPAIASSPTPVAHAPVISGDERRVELATPGAEIAFTSKGGRLLSWKLLEFKDSRGKSLEVHPGGNPTPGPLDLVTGRPDVDSRLRDALYRVSEVGQGPEKTTRFEFSDGTLEATKQIQPIKGGRAFRIDASVRQNGQTLPTRLYWGPGFGQPTDEEKALNGYLHPQLVEVDSTKELRLQPKALAEPRNVNATYVGVETKYFAAVFTREDRSEVQATAAATRDKDPAVELIVPLPIVLTVGAKEYDRLKELDLGVEKVVPVGSWLGPIVVPLTRALRAVEARVGNYGVAIILLTMAIALTLSPLRHYAILSSAKMAKVAPQIRAVQERYKRLSLTDPKRQQMSQEISDVYQKNGIDMVRQTAAGCLPTLLTMPFLFAFYRMLDISVALKGAPFLWIPDLSLKDPLFITPLLSGLSMIAMQRLMPAPAVDPAQQRMMLLMPIIFSGMFAWAPAGLNLYWFVSNLCAMVQQALAMYFAPHLFPRVRESA